ncbi:unnamed protein product [Anisakis simplex]|uniref:Uncharacterized protein n=1 Tax=Anisakis simplex TaxID=6269 RepID=A0A158PP00_ANISI|nr:unnamed protein product [Anisakis simplex]
MSVDKTIEELSSTLAQLGTLVNHINAQVVGITSRINITLETFDSSVAGVATDASALTHQIGLTVSQIPNAWVFYLLLITLTVVFILLSIVLTINLLTKCHGMYRLVREPRGSSSNGYISDVSHNTNSEILPIYEESKTPTLYTMGSARSPPVNHIAIPMEYEPRRVGYPIANGSIRDNSSIKCDSSIKCNDKQQPYQRKPYDVNDGGRYNVQAGVAIPFDQHGAEV